MRKFFSILMNMMFAFIMIGAFAFSAGMKKIMSLCQIWEK